jgi:hypothetical protein
MPEDTLGPDTFSTRGIPTARRGYDRKVVDALVADAVAAWGALEKRYGELIAEIERSGGLQHLSRDLGAIAADVGRVLTAATEAADGIPRAPRPMPTVAAESAAASRASLAAMPPAEADRQAFSDGMPGTAGLRVSVQQAIADVRAAADDEAQMIRADGKEKLTPGDARKEADEIVCNAKFEADRQLNLARFAQEMLDRAQGLESQVIPPSASATAAADHGRDRPVASERTIEEVVGYLPVPAPRGLAGGAARLIPSTGLERRAAEVSGCAATSPRRNHLRASDHQAAGRAEAARMSAGGTRRR